MSYKEKFRSSSIISMFFITLVMGIVLGLGVSVWATSIGTNISTADLTATGSLATQSTSATSTVSTGGFNVASGAFIVQQTSGAVAVASTTPWGLLSIEETALNPVFVVSDKGTTSPSFIILGSGNAGFGTTTPISVLSVQGNVLISATTTTGSLIATGTALLAQNGGLVGIATVTPAQTLSVGGSVFVGASAGGGTIGGLGVGNATTTAGAIENTGDVLFGDAATDKVMIASGDVRYNNIGTTTISQRNVAGWSIATSTSPAPFMRYDTSNGRVGIATGTPTATFTVKGDTYTTGGLTVGEQQATTTPGVIETASSTGVSLFKTDVNVSSAGTSTLRLSPAGAERGGCIEFKMNGSTFALYATSAGPAMIRAEACE